MNCKSPCVAALFLLPQLVCGVYAAVAGNDEAGQQSLIPVLVGFALTLAMLLVGAPDASVNPRARCGEVW